MPGDRLAGGLRRHRAAVGGGGAPREPRCSPRSSPQRRRPEEREAGVPGGRARNGAPPPVLLEPRPLSLPSFRSA